MLTIFQKIKALNVLNCHKTISIAQEVMS